LTISAGSLFHDWTVQGKRRTCTELSWEITSD